MGLAVSAQTLIKTRVVTPAPVFNISLPQYRDVAPTIIEVVEH